MTRRLFISVIALLSFIGMRADDIAPEHLFYDIYYKCSFINEEAASAAIQVTDYGGNFNAILNGHSKDIMGRIYCINDTLQSTFMASGENAHPATENVSYMSGYYRKPRVGEMSDPYSPESYRTIDGQGLLSADDATIECVTLTADMLCMFYYAKTVDFANMEQGSAVDVPIIMPDGTQRTLQLTYQGMANYQGRPAYSLIANFTYGDSFSAYPINIMIDTQWQIPLQFAASIAIGDVHMDYRF